MQEIVKCVRPRLPRAKTFVFRYGYVGDEVNPVTDRSLEVVGEYMDPTEWVSNGDGYLLPGSGDSGGGYMVTDGTEVERYTFLAMVGFFKNYVDEYGNIEPMAPGSYVETTECRLFATKLTEDIVGWFYSYVTSHDP